MSENKREKMKITLEMADGNTRVIECDGIAGLTFTDLEGDKHQSGVVIAGMFADSDFMEIHHDIKTTLLPALEDKIVENLSPKDMLKVVLRNILKDKGDE